jgi:hypothetical protein
MNGRFMNDTLAAAERALEVALAQSGARDPRDFYRERLRELKGLRPDEYRSLVGYYTDILLPEVAEHRRDALAAWTEYGRRLAEALAPGRTVAIDDTGRARPYDPDGPVDHDDPAASVALILHLPNDGGARALLVALPRALSPAQRATYDVLVSGRQRIGSDADLP